MERDNIISFAKQCCNWLNPTITQVDIIKEIEKTTNLNVSNSAWSSAFICYVYNKSGCASKIINSTVATTLFDKNTSISYKWPKYDADRVKILQKIQLGDIIIWKSTALNGKAGIVVDIISGDETSKWRIITVEGSINGDVKQCCYLYPFKDSYGDILGFICPNLTGSPTTSYQTNLGNYSFSQRNNYDPNKQLRYSDFNSIVWNDYDYQFSYYLGNSIQNAPAFNTQKTDANTSLPSMVGYCQGRAREVWDNQFPFQFGKDLPEVCFPTKTSDDEKEIKIPLYNYYYCSTNSTMYQRKYSSGKVIWEKLYVMPDNNNAFVTPFQIYRGPLLKGTPHQMFRQALNNGMSIECAYKQPSGINDYSRFSTNKNDKCVAKPGSIIVWAQNNVNSNQFTGYCAFVEKVRSDNLIYVTMSGREPDIFFESFWVNPYCFCNGYAQFLNNSTSADYQNRLNRNGIYFLGYIYPPDNISYNKNNYYFIQNSSELHTERVWVI